MVRKGMAEPRRSFRRTEREAHPGVQGAARSSNSKRAVNLSVDADVLQLAKEMGINLSQALEQALKELTADERAKRFYEANKAFMDWHNELVERHGTLSEIFAREFGDGDQTV